MPLRTKRRPARKTAATKTSFRLPADVVATLKRLNPDNATAALVALVRAAGRPTLTLVEAPGQPGLWISETPADWGLERRLNQPRDGDRSDQEGRIPRLVGRAAGAGITVVFRPGEPVE
jgi:hypothetical protein